MKALSFLWAAYAALAAALLWQWGGYLYWLMKGHSGILLWTTIASVYFIVGYAIVFAWAGNCSDPEATGWPAWRCYGLLAWSLATIHLDAFIPRFGDGWPARQQLVCLVLDAMFLGRLWFGRARGQKGWQWQIWAMLYLWLPALTRMYLARF